MDSDTALEVALRLRALADPIRVQLLTMILAAPSGEACKMPGTTGWKLPLEQARWETLGEFLAHVNSGSTGFGWAR